MDDRFFPSSADRRGCDPIDIYDDEFPYLLTYSSSLFSGLPDMRLHRRVAQLCDLWPLPRLQDCLWKYIYISDSSESRRSKE